MSLNWSPDGRLIAAGCADGGIIVREGRTGRVICELQGHAAPVTEVHMNYAGSLLASSAWDETTRWWDLRSGEQLFISGYRDSGRHFTPDGNRQAFFATQAGVLETVHDQEYRLLPQEGLSALRELAIRDDNRALAVASEEGLYVWDLDANLPPMCLTTEPAKTVVFRPGASELIAGLEGGIRAWQLPPDLTFDERTPRKLDSREIYDEGPAMMIRLTADGRTLAASVGRKRIVIMDVDRPERVDSLAFDGTEVVDISPDGKFVAGSPWIGAGIKVWDAASGKVVKDWPESLGGMLAFSPDGKWLVIDTGHSHSFWDTNTWQLRSQRLDTGKRNRNSLSRDGAMLARMLSTTTVEILHPATGVVQAHITLPGLPMRSTVALSPDGTLLAVGRGGGGIGIWDLQRVRNSLSDLGLDWSP